MRGSVDPKFVEIVAEIRPTHNAHSATGMFVHLEGVSTTRSEGLSRFNAIDLWRAMSES